VLTGCYVITGSIRLVVAMLVVVVVVVVVVVDQFS
jgi:hypothetical protein